MSASVNRSGPELFDQTFYAEGIDWTWKRIQGHALVDENLQLHYDQYIPISLASLGVIILFTQQPNCTPSSYSCLALEPGGDYQEKKPENDWASSDECIRYQKCFWKLVKILLALIFLQNDY